MEDFVVPVALKHGFEITGLNKYLASCFECRHGPSTAPQVVVSGWLGCWSLWELQRAKDLMLAPHLLPQILFGSLGQCTGKHISMCV